MNIKFLGDKVIFIIIIVQDKNYLEKRKVDEDLLNSFISLIALPMDYLFATLRYNK
jgi:hypothetical protein